MNDEIPASVLNTNFFSKIANGDVKSASEAATDYTRITLRDEGIVRGHILPVQTITEADLDAQLNTDKPVKIVEKEVTQPLSVSIPFGALPSTQYMNMDKYPVVFARISTERFVKDMQEVRTWQSDIRNIFKDNAIKDMSTAEDVPFFQAINSIVAPKTAAVGTGSFNPANAASAVTGKVQFYDFSKVDGNPLGTSEGFTRNTTVEMLKILPTGYPSAPIGGVATSTPVRLRPHIVVMNVNTGADYLKFTRDQVGGDMAEQMFKDGLKEGNLGGVNHYYTLKDDVVPDGWAYIFAAPQYLGRFYELEAPTMFLELRAYMLEFFVYSCVGASIGNPYAVSAVKFF